MYHLGTTETVFVAEGSYIHDANLFGSQNSIIEFNFAVDVFITVDLFSTVDFLVLEILASKKATQGLERLKGVGRMMFLIWIVVDKSRIEQKFHSIIILLSSLSE